MSAEILATEYGSIRSDFARDQLSDLCIEKVGVQTGPFGSQLHNEDYVKHGTPIITVEHLGENRILHQNTPCVSDADKERLSKYHLQTGDIVFSRVGSVDRRALVRESENGWLFSGRCLRVRVDKKKIDPVYLSYFFGLENFKQYIRSIAVGATMPSINTKILSDVPIYYPKIEEQKLIANLLYTLDEKIQLNRQFNQTLEEMAQAIFKSWFVDFEPVKAKVDGQNPERAAMCAISGKTDAELDQLSPDQLAQLRATAALFPDELTDSELGLIPKGWEVGLIKDCCLRVESGGTPKRKESNYWNGSISWLSSGEVRDVIIVDTKEKITEEGLKKSSAKLWPSGSTVVAMYGATAGQVCLLAKELSANQACCALIPKKNCQSYIFLAARRSIEDLSGKASGSAQQNLNKSLVSDHRVLTPTEQTLKTFEHITAPFLDGWVKNTKQNKTLAQLRDTLLPKLLSGEISVGSAQAIIKEVV